MLKQPPSTKHLDNIKILPAPPRTTLHFKNLLHTKLDSKISNGFLRVYEKNFLQ